MVIMGVDPGLNGGVAFMETSGKIIHFQKMPTKKVDDKKIIDIQQIAGMIAKLEPEHVFIEKVHSMPKQGVASTFTFGVGYGMVLGLCFALEALLRTELVTPQRWQKFMYSSMPDPKSLEPKARARLRFGELWPALVEENVTHDGIIDAMLIAEYGRRTLGLN
jgi:crossover junction endodeoxyribonuclease RuvC